MRIFIIFSLALASCSTAFAATDAGGKPTRQINDPSVAGKHPAEFAAINRALADDKPADAASAALALVAKTKTDASRNQGKPEDRKLSDSTYWAAWRVCLQVRQQIADPIVKKSLRDEWVKGLTDGEDDVKWQLYALADVWDRDFFTGDFWQLLRRTEEQKTLSAICFLLYARGDTSDIVFLQEKRKYLKKSQDQLLLDRTIAWLDYKRGSRQPGATPPAGSPPGIE